MTQVDHLFPKACTSLLTILARSQVLHEIFHFQYIKYPKITTRPCLIRLARGPYGELERPFNWPPPSWCLLASFLLLSTARSTRQAMPVTRSATRAAKQHSEVNAVKKRSRKRTQEIHIQVNLAKAKSYLNTTVCLNGYHLKTHPMTSFLTATNCFLPYKRCTNWKDATQLREGTHVN